MNSIMSLDQAARHMLRLRGAVMQLLDTVDRNHISGESVLTGRWALQEIFRTEEELHDIRLLANAEHLPDGSLRLADGRIISSVTID